jgi:hypothetical protein
MQSAGRFFLFYFYLTQFHGYYAKKLHNNIIALRSLQQIETCCHSLCENYPGCQNDPYQDCAISRLARNSCHLLPHAEPVYTVEKNATQQKVVLGDAVNLSCCGSDEVTA